MFDEIETSLSEDNACTTKADEDVVDKLITRCEDPLGTDSEYNNDAIESNDIEQRRH